MAVGVDRTAAERAGGPAGVDHGLGALHERAGAAGVQPDEVFLVRIDAASARAFVKRAAQVLEAGRPSCPFCGNPIDPDGHLCVRANGFRRRDP